MTANVDPYVRKTLSLPTSMWRRVADYRFNLRYDQEASALRYLIECGLKAAETDPPKPHP